MKKIMFKISILFGIIITFVIVNMCISSCRINGPFVGENEFLSTIDLNDTFADDAHEKYRILFELKSNKNGVVDVTTYADDLTPKYAFHEIIETTTNYEKYEVIVTPTILDTDDSQTILAFYSTYGTGVVVEVRNIEIEGI